MRNLTAAVVAATAAIAGLAPGAATARTDAPVTPQARSAAALVGTFALSPGRYSRGKASGTYFRMIFPGGRGYFRNPDSSARDKSYTLLRAGTAGGLATGRFQPAPRPAFTSSGDARAALIIRPTRFANIKFGLATQARDPQSGRSVPPPRITAVGRRLSGQVHALTAAWNKLYFNQGSPKPGSSRPLVTGSYNPRTRAFTLVWRSRIKRRPVQRVHRAVAPGREVPPAGRGERGRRRQEGEAHRAQALPQQEVQGQAPEVLQAQAGRDAAAR